MRLSQPLLQADRTAHLQVQGLRLNECGADLPSDVAAHMLEYGVKRLVWFGERREGTRLSGVAATASAAVNPTQGARIADIDPGSEAQLNILVP